MASLATDLRRQLENVVVQARDLAESAARAASRRWAVDAAEPFEHFSAADRAFRNRLRARGRQAGDRRSPDKTQEIDRITGELAYEYWHRMLFARFLAENHLLMHPDGVAVTLAECEELAPSEGAANGFVLAARYASRMLPEIFRTDDVLLEVELPINDRLPLERKLAELPRPVFTADDSLGWVYQFWQTEEKKRVNKSGQKVDGRTLPAVTQLFTEHYMVEFLLHNTIGAWWCAREGITGPPGGAGVPGGQCPVRLDYLRWKDDGTPAAGAFEGWPKSLREFTMLDPCCGSGHFLVAGFHLLVPLRRHDEGLSAREAVDAVLRENLYGLELDPRCTQIAAFALALAAWKVPGEDGQPLGYRPLPPLNVACSGQGVVGTKEDWVRFGNGDARFREGMERLYDLFQKAPTLGSLIDPRTVAEDLFALGFDTLRGTLERALNRLDPQADPDRAALGVAARGIALAASLMARQFTLVATNVPYLARGKQAEELRDYIADVHPAAKADLATAFVERCLEYAAPGGSTALVTPQNWLFLGSYKALRERLLRQVTWNVVAKLGPGAFETISGEVVNVALLMHTAAPPAEGHELTGLDVSASRGQPAIFAKEKADRLASRTPTNVSFVPQAGQLLNPDAIIQLERTGTDTLLLQYASGYAGTQTGDSLRYVRSFWELPSIDQMWERFQYPPEETALFTGRENLVNREVFKSDIPGSAVRGRSVWGKSGVTVSQMSTLPVTLYSGEYFADSGPVIIPTTELNILSALWCFCRSPEFGSAIRRLNAKLSVNNGYLAKVPFDLKHWQQVAAEEYSNGLPEPHSDDPTQWLFRGHPRGSTDPLQVAVARLLGYRWPDQEPDALDSLADHDGIVCLPAVRTEHPAADRLLDLLRAAYGPEWSPALLDRLLTDAGCKPGTTLDDWLRNAFFEQHCKRFHHRPFLWHIWDGRKDGFACLVNYHKLDHKRLESLTYSYLQDWITAQSVAAKAGQPGADLRLAAAQQLQDKLKLILAGEPPYDIFVRWKPLAEQPIGWNPDLNDGVRLNIRPFMTAGILRKNPNIKWNKDRGNEPNRPRDQFPWFWDGDTFKGERVNDVHLTNKQKQDARSRAATGS
jgi:hypothetical protein